MTITSAPEFRSYQDAKSDLSVSSRLQHLIRYAENLPVNLTVIGQWLVVGN